MEKNLGIDSEDTGRAYNGKLSLGRNGIPADDWFSSDANFHRLYPESVQVLAKSHWTPMSVARKVADYLGAEKNAKVLDIGSGAGKFCLVAGHHKPDAFYFGIEQRGDMLAHAERAREITGIENVSFIHGNITRLDLLQYDHFYFYNSFYENLVGSDRIDDNVEYSEDLYNYYNRYLYRQLDQTPSGTRLATFHSLEPEVPRDFHIVGSDLGNLLKFWVKE